MSWRSRSLTCSLRTLREIEALEVIVRGSVLHAHAREHGRGGQDLDDAGGPVAADAVAVLDLLGRDGGSDDRRDAELAREDGRMRHGAAGVRHEPYDLGEEDDPGRVRHLAHEDVARANVI